MSLKTYILLMLFSTVLAWTAWIFVISNVQPGVSGMVGLGLFFTTLCISLVGTLTLIGLVFRLLFSRRRTDGLAFRDVRISFRHAVLLSLVAVIALGLSSQGWLHWWAWLVLLCVAMLIEGLVLVLQSGRRN